ncbi:MAG: hypothetical protein M1837_000911 [Sclerophora amabilis]|nr:MAG: hypothetical protein M1837_000911 [Sclerophora amabilis]
MTTTIDDEESALSTVSDQESQVNIPSNSERTLLPAPIASIVSLVSKSSSVTLRLGTFLGGLAIDGARVGTLTGLELSRAVLETVFLQGGKDVVERSGGQLGKAEAENLLERSIASLHSTVTQASFLVSTSFHFSSVALSSASTLSLHLLSALDSILGSTESSRAIASIITLIRREFRNPETGVKGERVGVIDLLVGITGLALLQRWCHRKIDEDMKESKAEEVIWDVVVLQNGRRADVVGIWSHREGREGQTELTETTGGLGGPPKTASPSAFISATGQPEVYEAIQRQGEDHGLGLSLADDKTGGEVAESGWRQHLLDQLPPQAKVSITTDTVTTKTITVEVTGVEPPQIPPPPGTYIVEENAHHEHPTLTEGMLDTKLAGPVSSPHYRVVFQTVPTGEPLRGSEDGIASRSLSELQQEQGHVSEPPAYDSSSSPASINGYSSAAPSTDLEEFPRMALDVPAHAYSSNDDDTTTARTGKRQSKSTNLNKELPSITKAPSNSANQKRLRKPQQLPNNPRKSSHSNIPISQKPDPKDVPKIKQSAEKSEKRSSFRRALKKGASNTNLSNIFGKDGVASISPSSGKSQEPRPAWGSNRATTATKQSSPAPSRLPLSQKQPNSLNPTESPRAPQRGNPNFFTSRDLGEKQENPISPSRAKYYSIHERRRESMVSQTDTFSLHSADRPRPDSPTQKRTHLRAGSSLTRTQSSRNFTLSNVAPPSPSIRRTHTHAPSIYTLRTNNSESSLVVAKRPGSGALDDPEAISSLHRHGMVKGQFPQAHLVDSMCRFVRFASASYGSNFLRVMGISATSSARATEHDLAHHHEHHSFSSHTRLPPSTILLSSFVDPQGGTNGAGETNTGVPLIHFVSLDHDSKAVVLTCRGTLGLEDILTDMTCDFDDMPWNGRSYKVHKGIHASARRLLDGAGSRVMATIKAALEEFKDYGLVMCGHSLGGAVAALLAIMVSEKDESMSSNSAFVTTFNSPKHLSRITTGQTTSSDPSTPSCLPSGRPIHVFAYGPPASIAPSLRLATRGLITTVVNGQDIVPFLSLGTLHDLQAVALAFKTDTSNAKGEVRSRVWEALKTGLLERINGQRHSFIDEEDDQWAYSALKSLRANMLSAKLVPPGEVFLVETQPVLQRDPYTVKDGSSTFGNPGLGRPARRAVLKFVRDVEGRFGELRFGTGVLGDHSPGRYEMSLAALSRGVLDG